MRYALTAILAVVMFGTLFAQEPPPVVFQTEKDGEVEIPPGTVAEVLRSLSPEKAKALTDYANKFEAQRDEAALIAEIDAVRPLIVEMADADRHAMNEEVKAACDKARATVTVRREEARKKKEAEEARKRQEAGEAAAQSSKPSSITTRLPK